MAAGEARGPHTEGVIWDARETFLGTRCVEQCRRPHGKLGVEFSDLIRGVPLHDPSLCLRLHTHKSKGSLIQTPLPALPIRDSTDHPDAFGGGGISLCSGRAADWCVRRVTCSDRMRKGLSFPEATAHTLASCSLSCWGDWTQLVKFRGDLWVSIALMKQVASPGTAKLMAPLKLPVKVPLLDHFQLTTSTGPLV